MGDIVRVRATAERQAASAMLNSNSRFLAAQMVDAAMCC